MINRPDTRSQRIKRHKRVRAKISGTPERPRLNVFRSNTNIYAQVIDDVTGKTLVSASSLEKGILSKCEYGYKVLGNGTLTKKLTVRASAFSASAKEKIVAAGGKYEVV